MMFRSSHADEESGSDWDDYSPAPTPQPPPAAAVGGGSPAHRLKSLPQSSVPATTAAHVTHTIHTAGLRGSPHDVLHKSPHGGARLHDHHTSNKRYSPIDRNIKPLETELTTLSTVTPPRTPAANTPPAYTKPAALYRTNGRAGEGDDPAISANIAVAPPSLDDHDQLLQPHPGVYSEAGEAGGGGRVQGGGVKVEGAMEFVHVATDGTKIIIPSHDRPYSYMGGVADKSEECTKRCVEEVFSTVRVVSDFIIVFLLGCCHYLLNNVTRKLCCGLAHIATDSLFKPLVHLCFNGCCWPVISMLRHICEGGVVMLHPLLDFVRALVSMATGLVAACRPVQVNIHHKHNQPAV